MLSSTPRGGTPRWTHEWAGRAKGFHSSRCASIYGAVGDLWPLPQKHVQYFWESEQNFSWKDPALTISQGLKLFSLFLVSLLHQHRAKGLDHIWCLFLTACPTRWVVFTTSVQFRWCQVNCQSQNEVSKSDHFLSSKLLQNKLHQLSRKPIIKLQFIIRYKNPIMSSSDSFRYCFTEMMIAAKDHSQYMSDWTVEVQICHWVWNILCKNMSHKFKL